MQRAVVLRGYGLPELLRLEKLARPKLRADEIRLRVLLLPDAV